MRWLDPAHLINTFGVAGMVAVIFAESGLFVGFLLPGDSLLVTAGLASTRRPGAVHLNIAVVSPARPSPRRGLRRGAGDHVGYVFGNRAGRSLSSRPRSRLFRPEHLQRAHEYLEKRGSRVIVLARFVPVVRTFTPVAMELRRARRHDAPA